MKYDFRHIDPLTGMAKEVRRTEPEIQLMNRYPTKTGWIWVLQNRVGLNTVGNKRYKKKLWYDRTDKTISSDEAKEDSCPFMTYNLPGAGRPGGWLYGDQLNESFDSPKYRKVIFYTAEDKAYIGVKKGNSFICDAVEEMPVITSINDVLQWDYLDNVYPLKQNVVNKLTTAISDSLHIALKLNAKNI